MSKCSWKLWRKNNTSGDDYCSYDEIKTFYIAAIFKQRKCISLICIYSFIKVPVCCSHVINRIRICSSGKHLGDFSWLELNTMSGKRKEDTHTHMSTYTRSTLQEEAHCVERRSMEGSGHVRRGKAETSRRLFSVSLSPPLSGDPAGQCFAPGYNLSVQGEGTVHFQQVISVQTHRKM